MKALAGYHCYAGCGCYYSGKDRLMEGYVRNELFGTTDKRLAYFFSLRVV